MKLVEFSRTPNSRRVRIFLAEKRIEVPTEQVDLGKLEHKSESGFSETQSVATRAGSCAWTMAFVFSESVAICRYFEESAARSAA